MILMVMEHAMNMKSLDVWTQTPVIIIALQLIMIDVNMPIHVPMEVGRG